MSPHRHISAVLAVLFALAVNAAAAQQKSEALVEGRRALMQGRIPEALSKLESIASSGPESGEAHLLLCRTYYAERNADAAVRECEVSLQTLGKDSKAQDWMGKAYGMKADRVGPLTGYGLAKKVKAAFETAVSLDPTNSDAIDDLGDYYVQAPGIVGGGVDKAKALAARTQPAEKALRLQAAIAEKEKDYGSAERLFKDHVRVTNGRPDTWLDLADFYKRRKQIDEAVDALVHAQAATHDKGSILVGIAELLEKMQRNTSIAISNLQEYIKGGNTDDSAPTFRAHVLLGKMLSARGDKVAAKLEFDKALALAPDYEPAKKALASL